MSFFGSYILNTAHVKQPSGLGMITGTFEKRAPENRTQELGIAEQEGPVLISDSWLFSIWVINHLWCPWKIIFCLEKFGDVGRAGKNNTVQTTFDFLLPSPFDVSIRVNTVEDNNTTTFTEIPVDKLISNKEISRKNQDISDSLRNNTLSCFYLKTS